MIISTIKIFKYFHLIYNINHQKSFVLNLIESHWYYVILPAFILYTTKKKPTQYKNNLSRNKILQLVQVKLSLQLTEKCMLQK